VDLAAVLVVQVCLGAAAAVVGTIPLPVLLAVLVIPQHQHLHLIQMHSKVIQAEQAQ
jgi:site-specific recombinase